MPRQGVVASFGHAIGGLLEAVARGRTMKIQLVCALLVALVGSGLVLGLPERLALLVCVGAVLAAEAFNTALEATVDLVTAEFHEKARLAKDAAAGAVLVLALVAALVLLAVLVDHAPAMPGQAGAIARQLAAGVPLAVCAGLLLGRFDRGRAADLGLALAGLALLGLLATWTTSAAFTLLAALIFGTCVAVAARRKPAGVSS